MRLQTVELLIFSLIMILQWEEKNTLKYKNVGKTARSLCENTPTTSRRIKVIHKFTISCAQLSAPANGRRDEAISNTRSCD